MFFLRQCFDAGNDELLLVGKKLIKSALRHLKPFGNVVHLDGFHALREECFCGEFNDSLTVWTFYTRGCCCFHRCVLGVLAAKLRKIYI